MDKFLKYFPLRKIDEASHTVWGVATSETPDHDKEICDYESAKAAIKVWSDDQFAKTTAAGQEPSLGNMRVMHQLQIGGKAIKIEYHDAEKEVWVGSEPANDEVWHLLKGGFLTMHSIGGSYVWKRKDGDYTRFAPTIGEISYVDKGSNPDAVFSYVKADGSTELRKFSIPGPAEKDILAKLQGGIGNLSDSDVDKIVKAFDSELNTHLEKITTQLADLVGKHTPAKGADMNKEQIEKCAKALGITVEEFTKTYIEGDALEKGKKGLAALHSHLKKAIAVHAKLHEMHKAMADHHKDLHEHLQDCMKAHGACMEDGEAEKILKALIPAPIVADPDPALFVKKADVDAQVKKAAEDAVEAFKKANPKGDNADGIRVIPRDADFVKAVAAAGSSPDPIIR